MLAATLTFRVLGYSASLRGKRGFGLVALLLVIVAVPLVISSSQIADRWAVEEQLENRVFQVNGKDADDYFTRPVDRTAIRGPLTSLKVVKKVDIFVNAEGGGVTGQAGAVRMGLGRALTTLYPDAHPTLRDNGHLSRDARMVERKKPGRHGARRGHQWGKR